MPRPGKVTEYAVLPGGSRRRAVEIDGITVMVEPHDDDEAARRLADELSNYRETAAALMTELAAAKKPVVARKMRLMGPAHVRMSPRGDGRIFMLNKREGKPSRGFGEFGFEFDGWDSLFRTWNVVVIGHGTDEHGEFWEVDNALEA